ncbi:MAG: tetratricopeptide repeat protein [Saprospiraceae bacterium]|jgi:tetratricopeptide (TPR) repeat protein|nr:tetratricopeptide repeat protein [Saprospiraceae bacterium]
MKTSLLFLSVFVLHSAFGQTDNPRALLGEARRLAESGRHEASEALYKRVLAQSPNDSEALIGSAYNYSWWKQYNKARLNFESALAINPDNSEALVGQGYNYAWSGNFEMAKAVFERLSKQAPDNVEALKGMGYVQLWRGNGYGAEPYFRSLVTKYPNVAEYRIALAQAYLLRHEVKNARLVLQSVLQIDSTNRTAAELLKNTYGIASPLELDVWAGYSSTGGESRFALRNVQLTSQLSRKLRMYLRYDNSLTSDLAALVRTNQQAQAFSLGGGMGWNKSLTTRLEIGARFLPDHATQQLCSGEQIVFFPNGMLVKAGGFLGQSDEIADEWLAYAGFRVPVRPWYAFEPHYFLSRVEAAPRPEHRFMLNNQLRSRNGYELNLGVFFGKAAVPEGVSDDQITGSYITAILPVSQSIWGQLSFRWEDLPFDDLTVLAAGIKLRLEK